MERKGRGASAPKAAGRGNQKSAGAGSSRPAAKSFSKSSARPSGKTAPKAPLKITGNTAANTSGQPGEGPEQASGRNSSQGSSRGPARGPIRDRAQGGAQRSSGGSSGGATRRPTGQKPEAPRRPGSTDTRRPRNQEDGERLQKILAHAGVASRRACESLITDGHVQVNGVTVKELGAKANPRRDEITVDFKPIQKENLVYILMNKPKGYVTTVKDDEGRPTVLALLNGVTERVYPVGRLDFQSEGLLLMTNDGAMAQRMTSPEFHIPKVYLVKVHRTPKPETLDEMREGFRLDGRKLKPCSIEFFDKQENPWLKVTLTEGKNQQIRKMFAAVGHPVHKLRRVAFGPLDDPYLKPGAWRHLTPAELTALKNL